MSITTIGLVLVQHFHRHKDTSKLPAAETVQDSQPTTIP